MRSNFTKQLIWIVARDMARIGATHENWQTRTEARLEEAEAKINEMNNVELLDLLATIVEVK